MPLPITRIIEPVGFLPPRTYSTGRIPVPGIATGAAYTAGDAFGIKGYFPVPLSGIIQTAIFYDIDDEGLETDLVLFDADFLGTADNAAFDVADVDLPRCIGTITWATTDFKNFTSNQIGTVKAIGLAYVAPERRLYFQMVARGAPNIAAGNIPLFSLIILPDM